MRASGSLAVVASCMAVVAVQGCGGTTQSSQDARSSLVALADAVRPGAPACWPGSANTYDATTRVGCIPSPTFRICEVPGGSTWNGDGTVTMPDGRVADASCTDACSPTEYALTCRGPGPGAIPLPAASLGACRSIPVPTPAGALFHCCPCAP